MDTRGPQEGAGRSRAGKLIPRGTTAMELAIMEVKRDLENGYQCAAMYMTRTEYRLRPREFTIYRYSWDAIRQAIEDGLDDLL
jgi:hypothetical protein